MSLINKEIGEFTVQAYHEGAFKTVSKADVLGKGLFRRERAVKAGYMALLRNGLKTVKNGSRAMIL